MEREKKATSYLDEIGGNREAIGYDKEQEGLAHEQEVAPANNWGDDKRDSVGRAATIENKKRRLAKKLLRISRELEALGKMEEAYQASIDEMLDDDEDTGKEKKDDYDYDYDDEGKKKEEKSDDSSKDDPMAAEMGTEHWLDANGREARHPIQHDPNVDDPDAFRSSQMGDDEWISIGQEGSAWGADKRDPAGRAAK